MEAGTKALEILCSFREAATSDFRRKSLRALEQSKTLHESMGDFAEADQCHYIASRLRREGTLRSSRLSYGNPAFLLSLILDVSWRYGTRPWRLLPVAILITVAFWGLYIVSGDLQWMGGSSGAQRTMPYAMTALILSLKAILPAQWIEWIGKVSLLPAIGMGTVSKALAAIESVLGLVISMMVAFSVTRWIKRQLPTGS